jgi:hypothetical protein
MIPIEETGYTQYTGTGSRTFFEYGFTFIEGSGIKVLVDGVTPVFEQQDNGVVITPAPVLNAVVVLFRLTNVDQLSDWVPFESFDAEKTEDACDKLIMLKSELWFRGPMNLTSEHLLDRIILHNDKGTDAHLLIWNELHPSDDTVVNQAGVFAGEVTTDMPEPGTFVLKPDDFAYFQYGDAVANELILTSTPYPIEVDDSARFAASLTFGAVWSWPEDELDIGFSLSSIDMQPGLIDGPVSEDELDTSFSLSFIEMFPVLIDGPVSEDDVDTSFSLTSIDMEKVLIEVDTREDGARFATSLVSADVSPVGAVVYDRFSEAAVKALNIHTPDIDNVGSGWIHRVGVLSVNLDGEVELTTNGTAIATIDSGLSDGEIFGRHMDCTVAGSTESNSGIVFRYVDNDNYWWFGLASTAGDPWTWAIYRVVAGTQVVVAGPTAGITGGEAGFEPDMIITLAADAIRAQIVSEGIDLNVVDSAHQSATDHGLILLNVSSRFLRCPFQQYV